MLMWFNENYGWILSILLQGFIAYHIFFLSKRLSYQARLEHKEKIKEKTRDLLASIYDEDLNREVYHVNINRYFKDYPSNEEKLFNSYSHIKAEIKSTRFDGVQFFASMPRTVYQKSDGTLTFNKHGVEVFNVYPVGLVPYEWIKYVDLEGDEYEGVPLFYSKFKGRVYWKNSWRRFVPFGYPYKEIVYYRESEVYYEGNDPPDMKYHLVRQAISEE